MEMTQVNSSNISAAGYDAETQTLRIEFNNGGVYEYSQIPEMLWQAFQENFGEGGSAGSFFAKNIRPFPYKKLA